MKVQLYILLCFVLSLACSACMSSYNQYKYQLIRKLEFYNFNEFENYKIEKSRGAYIYIEKIDNSNNCSLDYRFSINNNGLKIIRDTVTHQKRQLLRDDNGRCKIEYSEEIDKLIKKFIYLHIASLYVYDNGNMVINIIPWQPSIAYVKDSSFFSQSNLKWKYLQNNWYEEED